MWSNSSIQPLPLTLTVRDRYQFVERWNYLISDVGHQRSKWTSQVVPEKLIMHRFTRTKSILELKYLFGNCKRSWIRNDNEENDYLHPQQPLGRTTHRLACDGALLPTRAYWLGRSIDLAQESWRRHLYTTTWLPLNLGDAKSSRVAYLSVPFLKHLLPVVDQAKRTKIREKGWWKTPYGRDVW